MSAPIRLVIAGSRTFSDYPLLAQHADAICFECVEDIPESITIISGGARGADALGEQYARLCNLPCERYPAEWDKYGKSAGYIRNEQMAKICTHILCFWDGQSRGTSHMISLAARYQRTLKIVRF